MVPALRSTTRRQCPLADVESLSADSALSRRPTMTEVQSTSPWVYLDNNATTRVDQRVVDAMLPYFRDHFANPSSAHALGVASSDAVRVARGQIQALLGAESEKEIIFTSGGSESNNTAILSALELQQGRDEIITSTVEHSSVLAVCDHLERTSQAAVHRIPVDSNGRLDRSAYRRALNKKTALVSIQWANNETGVLFPIGQLADEAVAALGFWVLLHLPFEVGARQVVEKYVKLRAEQVGPLLFQPDKQLPLVLQQAVQTSIQPILLGHREVGLQQLIHRAIHEPLPVHVVLAARIEQAIHHQQAQHFLPTHRLTSFRQTLLPKLIQPELLPQLAG